MKNAKEALSKLRQHSDPDVRAAAVIIEEQHKRRSKILNIVQEALSQLRLDMKYLVFDLEATRRERDEAKGAI